MMKAFVIVLVLHLAVASSPARYVRQTVIPSTGTVDPTTGTVIPSTGTNTGTTVIPSTGTNTGTTTPTGNTGTLTPVPYVPPTTNTGTTTGTTTPAAGTSATNAAGSTVSYPAGTTITFPAGATVNYPVGSTVTYQNPTTITYPQQSTVVYPNTNPTTYPAGTTVQYPAGTTVVNQPGTTTYFNQPSNVLYGNYGASNPGFVQYPAQTNVGYRGCSSAPISYPPRTPTSAYSYSPNYYGPTGNTTYVRNNDGTTSAVTVVGYTANGYPISQVTNQQTGVTSIVTQTGPNNYIVNTNGVTTNVVG